MKLGFSKTHMVIFVLILSFFTGYSESEIQVDVTVDQTKDLSGLVKVLNYNTKEGGLDPAWKDVIYQENPDIFIQVETGFIENIEATKNEFNDYFSNEIPYDVAAFEARSGTDGQAIYSRYPILRTNLVDIVILDDGTEHTINHAIIEAVLQIFDMEVHFFANHLSCCDSLPTRLLEQEGFINYMDTLGDVPILYGGDFNSESPEDVGDISSLQAGLGNEPIEMMLNNSHIHGPVNNQFIDTYRILNPDRKGYTFNNPAPSPYESEDHFKNRIDFIFVSHHLRGFLVNSSLVTDHPSVITASDHKPMYTWFNFKQNEIDLIPPLNPTKVILSQVSSDSTTISWNANTEDDLFKYSIYRNGSLLIDIPSSQSSFVDDYEYNSGVSYIYQVTATDIRRNEGRFSLPVYSRGDVGELYTPYDITTYAYTVGGVIGLNWSIDGVTHLPVKSIKVLKSEFPDRKYIIETVTNESNVVINIPNSFTLYLRITVINAIGESELTDFTFIGADSPSRSEIQPDRSNVFDYGVHLQNLVSDHSGPATVLEIPQETSSTVSTSETFDTSISDTNTVTDTGTDISTPLVSSQGGNVSLEFLLPALSLLLFVLPIIRRRHP